MDAIQLIKSLSRYSEKAMLILTGHSDPDAVTIKIGPALIFERLWKNTGIKQALDKLLKDRKFGFDVERAVFLTVNICEKDLASSDSALWPTAA